MRIPGLAGFVKVLPSLLVIAFILMVLYLTVRYLVWPKLIRPLHNRFKDWKQNREWRKFQYRIRK